MVYIKGLFNASLSMRIKIRRVRIKIWCIPAKGQDVATFWEAGVCQKAHLVFLGLCQGTGAQSHATKCLYNFY